MLDGLYCEVLKLKKTGFYCCILLVGLICLFFCTLNKQLMSSLNWYGYLFNFESIAFTMFYALVIPNIIAIIFIREFRHKTAPIAFSYPNGRFGAFINKFFVSVLVIAIIYIMSYIYIILSGFVFLKAPITAAPLINHAKVFLISFTFQVSLMPLTTLVALLGKNMIVSFVYSMGLLVGNANYFLGSKYKDYFFSILPASPVAKFNTFIFSYPVPIDKVITKLDIYLGIIVFVVGIIGCITYYNKANIH